METDINLFQLKRQALEVALNNCDFKLNSINCMQIGTSYYEAGYGPVLVLLHGAFSNGLCWLPVVPTLSKHFRVIIPDLPGHGCSGAPSVFYSRSFYTQWLSAFFKALGIDNVILCGNSLGGALAVAYAFSASHTLSRLVLVNSVGLLAPVPLRGNFAYIIEVLRLAIFPKLATQRSAEKMWKILLKNNSDFVSAPQMKHVMDFTLKAIQRKNGTRAFWHGQSDAARPFHSSELQKLSMQVTLVWGEQDPIAPLLTARQAQKIIPLSSIKTIKTAGHVPFIDCPEAFCEAVLSATL